MTCFFTAFFCNFTLSYRHVALLVLVQGHLHCQRYGHLYFYFVLFGYIQTFSLWVSLLLFCFTASEFCVILQKAVPTPLISTKRLPFNLTKKIFKNRCEAERPAQSQRESSLESECPWTPRCPRGWGPASCDLVFSPGRDSARRCPSTTLCSCVLAAGFRPLTSADVFLVPVAGLCPGLPGCPGPPADAARHLRAERCEEDAVRPAAFTDLFHLCVSPVGWFFFFFFLTGYQKCFHPCSKETSQC